MEYDPEVEADQKELGRALFGEPAPKGKHRLRPTSHEDEDAEDEETDKPDPRYGNVVPREGFHRERIDPNREAREAVRELFGQ